MQSPTYSEILALENARYAAMMSGDVSALDSLLDDELTYSHSNGLIETKKDYLNAFLRGLRKYQEIRRCDPRIIVRGDTALVYCQLHIRALVQEQPREVKTFALAVWTRAMSQWRLLALQSTARSG